MGKKLVIVESPAKAKTIKKYLGKDVEVLASYGHVRDLLPKEGAVDPANNFAMKYQVIDRNSKHVDAIAKAMKKADALYLATDPDREGEAISWHLYELLKKRGALKDKETHRVVFHEITKQAVNDAVAHPRELSMDLVNAQQARRALDYLVGFTLSPLLWKKVRRGLSAGRVQSPALRMIVERELEIEAFTPREYWTIEADAAADDKAFQAKLTYFEGDKLSQFSIDNEKQSSDVVAKLNKAAEGKLLVTNVEKKQRRRNPAAPFTTSTLQQEASRKLGFGAQRTMSLAQQLYEGVDTGDGAVGLITYMRTDSVSLANEAINEIRDFIAEKYGKKMVPGKPQEYKTKSKNAQEAHEAIRPTSVLRTPEEMKAYLSADQLKLYTLIWQRTMACQMVHATLNTVAVDLGCGKGNTFRANGSTVVNPGFMSVYLEGKDDTAKTDKDENLLPPMEVGEVVTLKAIRPEQHFTEPPPRFSEASLVRALEEHDIGRPSTYASIISTLLQREYVELVNKRFHPTDVGRVVGKFLVQHFTKYVDYNFTAELEDELDAVARGEEEWIPLLTKFWAPFKEQVETKDKEVQRSDVTQEVLDEDCPKCGKKLSSRLGRSGRFIGCTGYPECDYTRNIDGEETSNEPEVVEGRQCPKCDSDLWIRTGKYGKFIGCSSYPKCKHIESLEQPKNTGVKCPQCEKGEILTRKSRRGKVFYSCSEYPDCDYALWNEPLKEPCPKCDWPILTLKTTKSRGTEKVCPQKDCDFSEKVESA
ncbi:type I DNA topoisomerase [Methylophaga sp.]|jgi:DNA topoisomerase-1|uniref:type I DNA topoisomerase n=1 Tax=Methylophaga sp. TaxID=2024840 RepID=UPI001400A865|nr:type I DNA topoisomerase [Methylophaga sp.]MTI62945.1 type I DNA topoisomerase [Methylophaga sp.]